ncbi:DUF599 family protein [Aquibium carbonis]|uniref:DUF599 family protein n=1 Tax=Aquibium carbonis TaxID=2495581 RepID=A0A3R9YTE8_9HYPH|nr:DUF599 family protein [Aquibium carbonis]RST86651.1 DUF599 family protein [Aquibium carbonis]
MDIDSFHWTDASALAAFILFWVLFSQATSGRFVRRKSLTQLMNAHREAWMRTMARRELRMIDTGIMLGLQQGTAFFASSALLALGGCFALLQSSDKVLMLLADLPLAGTPDRAVYEVKVLGLMTVLAYAFFKFGWAYRLFNYCSILVGAVPMAKDGDEATIETAVLRAANMNVIAGGHFNSGLRGLFFSIGYLGWFVGPAVLVMTTLLVLIVLVRRQFFSTARAALLNG